ncbi:MAG: outer membrane beta-barrel protein [Jannaschia sp.]
MRILLPAALLLLSAAPLAAQDGYGGYGGPTGNWSGSYVSGSLGFGRTASSSSAAGPTVSVSDISTGFSVAAGHQVQSGSIVYGGEIAIFDVTGDLGPVGANLGVDFGLRAAARVGYDLGESMVYGTVGLARADFNGAGIDEHDNALTVGAGIDLKVTDRINLGAEYMHYRFGEVSGAAGAGAPADVNLGTLGLKVTYGF